MQQFCNPALATRLSDVGSCRKGDVIDLLPRARGLPESICHAGELTANVSWHGALYSLAADRTAQVMDTDSNAH
jgi:hypothetical protein